MTFNTKGLMSSLTDEWNTPKSLFEELDKEFLFDSDPCPGKIRLKDNITNNQWLKRVFVNPPFSEISKWVKDCYEHSILNNAIVVMLIPSRTDTRYWHDYVMKAKEIRFIKGRLKFNDGKGSAPFPSAIIVFKQ